MSTRYRLLPLIAALAALPGCFSPWWVGTWTSQQSNGVPDTTVTVTCPNASPVTVASNVTLMFDQCTANPNFSLQFQWGVEPLSCTGTGSTRDQVFYLDATCSSGWAITGGDLVTSADPFINALQTRLSGTAPVGNSACAMEIEGPLYFETSNDTLCSVPDGGEGGGPLAGPDGGVDAGQDGG